MNQAFLVEQSSFWACFTAGPTGPGPKTVLEVVSRVRSCMGSNQIKERAYSVKTIAGLSPLRRERVGVEVVGPKGLELKWFRIPWSTSALMVASSTYNEGRRS